MEVRWEILMIIVGTGVVTLIPRVLPLVVLSRFELPEWLLRWLSFVPISVMAALLAQEVLIKDGALFLSLDNLELIAIIPVFMVAVYMRSLLGAVVVGVLGMSLLRWFV